MKNRSRQVKVIMQSALTFFIKRPMVGGCTNFLRSLPTLLGILPNSVGKSH